MKWDVNGPIYSYQLFYHEETGPKHYFRPDASAKNYTITDLKPGTTYTITLTPNSMLGPGSPVSTSVTTCGGSK